MEKTLVEITAEIVKAKAGHTVMSADDMNEALRKTFEALRSIKAKEEKEEVTEEKDELAALRAEPIKSIRENYIINLEDGKQYKQLTARTLAKFGLTPKEYRKKYGLSARQPLSAKSLTAKRRKTAKALRLGERMLTARKGKVESAFPENTAQKVDAQNREKAEVELTES
jgi:predicted transcriptional regulator